MADEESLGKQKENEKNSLLFRARIARFNSERDRERDGEVVEASQAADAAHRANFR